MLKNNWKLRLRILRQLIDLSDFLILKLLCWRMRICKKIGLIKIEQNLPIYVPEREVNILESKRAIAKRFGFAGDFINDLFQLIMHESKRIQKIMQSD